MTMDLSQSERKLIERLRSDETFRIHIQRRLDGWNVTTAPALPDHHHPQNTGSGRTFDQAWKMTKDGN
jgi:hypothetical protein